MKSLRRAIERLVWRHDPRDDYAQARLRRRRSDHLVRENVVVRRTIEDEFRQMEQDILSIDRR